MFTSINGEDLYNLFTQGELVKAEVVARTNEYVAYWLRRMAMRETITDISQLQSALALAVSTGILTDERHNQILSQIGL